MKRLIITGDSISYNRHGFDDTPRADASDCHIGMDSWSFRLRKDFITSSVDFEYADGLEFSERTVSGLGDKTDIADAIFGSRVVTVTPENDSVHFTARSSTGKLALYFQCRPHNYCSFTITVDGNSKRADTYGDPDIYFGYALLTVEIDCDKNKLSHEVVLSDFEYTELTPLVTLAGVSGEAKYAHITGQGSRTVKFLLYHFEKRVAALSPDALVLTLGGNDFVFYSAEDYRLYLGRFFELMRERFPNCRIVTATIPPSAKPSYPIRNMTFESDAEFNTELEKYNVVMKELSLKYNAKCIDLTRLFDGISPSVWRYDSVHLSPKGNEMLYGAVVNELFNKNEL